MDENDSIVKSQAPKNRLWFGIGGGGGGGGGWEAGNVWGLAGNFEVGSWGQQGGAQALSVPTRSTSLMPVQRGTFGFVQVRLSVCLLMIDVLGVWTVAPPECELSVREATAAE